MSDWEIPPSVLEHLDDAPQDRGVVLLLRHSVRDQLPPGDVGYALPITEAGHRIALELGERLGDRLRTLHSSPLPRCTQTAEALRVGAGVALPVVPDRLLGDPGVYVIDGRRAWSNWEALGHHGVMRHLVTANEALDGMAAPDEAARFLVQHMLAHATEPGVHVFVTHDTLVLATAARLLGQPLGAEHWPWFLEGAFFWQEGGELTTRYRALRGQRAGALCSLNQTDVLELARREVAATLGLDSRLRFFLAGGAFKSLLTGCSPRDLDLWSPSDEDRAKLVAHLLERGAKPVEAGPFSDRYTLNDRVLDLPRKTDRQSLSSLLGRFDIALSAIGVEHTAANEWRVEIHPLAQESVCGLRQRVGC